MGIALLACGLAGLCFFLVMIFSSILERLSKNRNDTQTQSSKDYNLQEEIRKIVKTPDKTNPKVS